MPDTGRQALSINPATAGASWQKPYSTAASTRSKWIPRARGGFGFFQPAYAGSIDTLYSVQNLVTLRINEGIPLVCCAVHSASPLA